MKDRDGGPAFPVMWEENDPLSSASSLVAAPGMSLRDYFAGQALAGFCACSDLIGFDGLTKDAYEVADLMLAEREEEDNEDAS